MGLFPAAGRIRGVARAVLGPAGGRRGVARAVLGPVRRRRDVAGAGLGRRRGVGRTRGGGGGGQVTPGLCHILAAEKDENKPFTAFSKQKSTKDRSYIRSELTRDIFLYAID
jgi:hypothetical protein